jgi:hypothetical protein
MTIDKFLDEVLDKSAPIWVPFYALFHLIQELTDRKHH